MINENVSDSAAAPSAQQQHLVGRAASRAAAGGPAGEHTRRPAEAGVGGLRGNSAAVSLILSTLTVATEVEKNKREAPKVFTSRGGFQRNKQLQQRLSAPH